MNKHSCVPGILLRRLISFVLLIVIVLLFMPVSAFGTDNSTVSGSENKPLSFSAKSKPGSPNDGIDFRSLQNNYIYLGKYDHVASFTEEYLSANRNASSFTLRNVKYEGEERPILWQFMGEENSDGKMTLLSRYVLDIKPFNTSDGWLTYDYSKSSIRTWLNGAFSETAFSGSESDSIVPADVTIGIWSGGEQRFGDFTAIWGVAGRDTTAWPKYVKGDKLYLPEGIGFEHWFQNETPTSYYWEAGNTASSKYLLASDAILRSSAIKAKVWSRTPWPYSSNHVEGIYVYSTIGVRPAMKLNPANIILASELSEEVDDSEDYRISGDSGKYYKLTVINPKVQLSRLLLNETPLSNSTQLPIPLGESVTLTGTGLGYDVLAYKIVQNLNGNGTIVASGSGTKSEVALSWGKLDPFGDYTLYVWGHKNNAIISDEGSRPMYFRLVPSVNPKKTSVTVNGSSQDVETYKIGENNYFSLRSLAFLLSGTSAQFSLGWDAKTSAIILTGGQAYEPVGGELSDSVRGARTAARTTAKLIVNGKTAVFEAYTISDSYYISPQELSTALDFRVEVNNEQNYVIIEAGIPEIEEIKEETAETDISSGKKDVSISPVVVSGTALLLITCVTVIISRINKSRSN